MRNAEVVNGVRKFEMFKSVDEIIEHIKEKDYNCLFYMTASKFDELVKMYDKLCEHMDSVYSKRNRVLINKLSVHHTTINDVDINVAHVAIKRLEKGVKLDDMKLLYRINKNHE